MSMQSTDSDTENPSDEQPSDEHSSPGSAYGELLGVSSLEELQEKPWEVKLALLQHHLELARIFVGELLEEEVEQKAGKRYSHDDRQYSRWGTNPGSVRIGEEKVSIEVPRMIDTDTEETCSPERYFQMKELPPMTGKMQEAILLGLSQGDYERVASSFAGGFGLSQSAVSERFIERSAKALEEFETRSLEDLDLVALIMDAKHVAGKQLTVALGVTIDGKKVPLGFVEASTEHHGPVKSLLRDLSDRGLSYDQGLLFVTDGARGLSCRFKGHPGDRRGPWTHSALPVAQAGEHRRPSSQKRSQKMASEAAACLPEADLRGGQVSPQRAPRRASAGEPIGGPVPSGRPRRDAHAPSA